MSSPKLSNHDGSATETIPTEFTTFVANMLGVQLTRQQYVMCRVAFDGVEPGELETDEDKDFAAHIFGDVGVLPAASRLVIAAIIGGRSGKTYLFSLRLLHLGLTHSLSTLAPGELAFGLIVGPDKSLAQQALRYVSGAVNAHPSLKALIVSDTADWLQLKRPDGKVISIECRAASRGGRTGRGRSLFAALMDEACFFLDHNFVVNDDEIYKAISPRIMPGGQLMIPSTPWAEAGLLYDMWKANHPNNGGAHTTAIAMHAETTFLRPDEHTASFVERERERDPENAAREFDARPMSSVSGAFFDMADIRACIVDDLPDILVPKVGQQAWCGLDTGFRKDPSAAVVVRVHAADPGVAYVAECFEKQPPKGEKLKPTETIKELVDRARYHSCQAILADQHYIESVREQASGFTLTEAPHDNVEPYVATRRAFKDGRIRIGRGNEKLIAQLRSVVSKPTPGGNISVSSPRKGGQHGDLVSALVLAVWAATNAGGAVPVFTRGNVGVTAGWKRVGRKDRF